MVSPDLKLTRLSDSTFSHNYRNGQKLAFCHRLCETCHERALLLATRVRLQQCLVSRIGCLGFSQR